MEIVVMYQKDRFLFEIVRPVGLYYIHIPTHIHGYIYTYNIIYTYTKDKKKKKQ